MDNAVFASAFGSAMRRWMCRRPQKPIAGLADEIAKLKARIAELEKVLAEAGPA